MKTVVEPITAPSFQLRTGTVLTDTLAHQAAQYGAIVLPCEPGVGPNHLAEFSKLHFDMMSLPTGPNWVLAGPVIYLNGPSRIHWAMKFDLLSKDMPPSGVVGVIPSGGQTGTGLLRVAILESRSWQLATIDKQTKALYGSFFVNPPSHGFTAFDFTVAHPSGVRPVFVAMTRTSGR